jgi:site-specific recombinase XerD
MSEQKTKYQIPELISNVKTQLLQLKYSKETVRKFIREWDKFLIYTGKRKTKFYSIQIAEDYLKEKYSIEMGTKLLRKDHIKARSIQILTNFYLNNAINLRRQHKKFILPKTFKTEIDGFLNYTSEKNNTGKKKNKIIYEMYNFISFLLQRKISKISDISSQDIHEYIQTLTDYSRATVRRIIQVLSNFFVYLYNNGFQKTDLSQFLPSIKHLKLKNQIPSVYNEKEITKLLQSVDRENPIGKRNYAILLLATKLGLRTGDVRYLKLRNLKWENHEIELLQEKTGQSLSLPILKDIGSALIDYLKNGRPKVESEYVFLKHVPPYNNLTASGIYDIVIKYFQLSGIRVPTGKKHGLHSLRHSLASHLLEKGTPVVVISEVLGHLNSNTTSTYLKVDIKQLRSCSLEVPHGKK